VIETLAEMACNIRLVLTLGGELIWFSMIFLKALFLIPRLIATGFLLPKMTGKRATAFSH